MSAAFIIYLPDADENQREMALNEWKQFTRNNKFDILGFMTTESRILKMKSMGLPGDSLTLENSIIIQSTIKTPLLIDPNTQATEWLKADLKEKKNIEILNQ